MATPKEEWSYLNFVQEYLRTVPNPTREKLDIAWPSLRKEHKNNVAKLLERLL